MIKNLKKYGLILAWITSLGVVYGQNNNNYIPKINNLPTSPEVALLGRFGDIPIGYYTGTADISVPLYSIKEEGIEIPIQLRYHSSGIKVADEATWVGLGWDISPEGTIIQEIRGKEDNLDIPLGYLNETDYNIFKNNFNTIYSENYLYRGQKGFAGYNTNNIGISGDDDRETMILRLNEGYGNPDIYSYNFGSYSGKFYINPETKQIVLINSNDIIKFNKPNNSVIIATTKDGNKYYFDVIEKISKLENANITGYTFKLGSIKLTNGKQISFFYKNESNYHHTDIESAHITNFSQDLSTNVSSNTFYNNKKTLSTILTDNVVVNFNLEDREDIYPSDPRFLAKRLKSIDIIDNLTQNRIKSFLFNYSYFPYDEALGRPSSFTTNINSNNINYYGKRLKLDSIKEIGYKENSGDIDNSKPPYKFEYDMTNTMPLKTSTAVDYYGYFNGVNNNTLLPDLNYFNYFNDQRYQQKSSLNLAYPYIGAKRYTDQNYVSTYILNKIFYPTGGFTQFEYESNSFNNQFIPDKIQSESIFKNIYVNHNGYGRSYLDYHKEFKLSKTVTIHFENRIYDGYTPYSGNNTLYNYFEMMGAQIRFSKRKINGAGQYVYTTIKEWSLDTVLNVDFTNNHGVTWKDDITIEYDPDPSVLYYVDVVNPTPYRNNDTYHIASVSTRFTYYDDIDVNTNISYGGGVRIKSIKNYDTENNLKEYKLLNYYGGKLLNKFEPLTVLYGANYKSKSTGASQGGCFSEYIAIFDDLSISSHDFGLNEGTLIGYDKVEEVNLSTSNSKDIGKKIYCFYNTENISKKGLFPLINEFNGIKKKEEVLDTHSNKQITTDYIYSYLDSFSSHYPVFNIVTNSMGPYDPDGQIYPINVDGCGTFIGAQNYTLRTFVLVTKYGFWVTPLMSKMLKLKSKNTIEYNNNNKIQTSEDYFYNNYGDLTQVKNSSSNQTLTQKFYYPQDLASEPFMSNLIAQNRIGSPIKTETFENETKTGEQKTVFGSFPSLVSGSPLILPSEVWTAKGTQPTQKQISYSKYDTNGNILEYITDPEKSKIPTAVIWGYNKQYPIAKVEGANYSQIESQVANLQTVSNADIDTGINGTTENNLRTALNQFRVQNPNFRIQTYTYDPLIGATSVTDPASNTQFYEYDGFNRLTRLYDIDKKLVKRIEYNYKGYANKAASQTFTRNNCGAGGIGGTWTYTVPEGKYTAGTQAEADQQAQNEMNANGQNTANANAGCTYYNNPQSQTFQKNNCPIGGSPNGTYTYTVPANQYSSTISLADANQKAINDINANGQNAANANGSCIYYNDAQSRTFTSQYCAQTYTYTLPAGQYSSTISKADANQKAIDHVNANGQRITNENTCSSISISNITCNWGPGIQTINLNPAFKYEVRVIINKYTSSGIIYYSGTFHNMNLYNQVLSGSYSSDKYQGTIQGVSSVKYNLPKATCNGASGSITIKLIKIN